MMPLTALEKGKGISLAEDLIQLEEVPSSASTSTSSSELNSDSDSEESDSSEDESSDEEISEEFLNTLLERARQTAGASASEDVARVEEEVLQLGGDDEPLPPLETRALPTPYIEFGDYKQAKIAKVRDLDVEEAERSTLSRIPAAPGPPPSALPKGKPLTKKETRELKTKTTGKDWFDLPAPAEADLPRLYREVEALRLRNQLDPKRFYRKDEGESKGIKGLPKYFAIGTIVTESTPFGTASSENLPRSQRKRTLVDELVDDAEAKSYAKKKFKELQTVRGAKGRGTLAKRRLQRKPKW